MIPPEHNAEFVAHMEDVLEIYHLSYDPKRPVICMDEQPVQLVNSTRMPLQALPGQPESVDYDLRAQWNCQHFLVYRTFGRMAQGSRH